MGNSPSNANPGCGYLFTGLFDYPPLRRVKNPCENGNLDKRYIVVKQIFSALDGIEDYLYEHAVFYGIYDDMEAMYDTVFWLSPVLYTIFLVSLLLYLLYDLYTDRKSTEDKYPDYEYPKHYEV